ncbi:formylglycine-generating enzyme family protein [Sulfurimonas sp.]
MKKLVLGALLATSLLSADSFTNSIGMTFVEIPSGSFMMGTATKSTAACPKDDPFTSKNEYQDCVDSRTSSVNKDETPQHKVHVKSFYMQTTEVTQLQWYKVMGNNPAKFKKKKLGYDSRNNPVENVSWYDAKEFVKRLNKMEHTNKYRLPTEKEWEYAARAGSTGKWCFGNSKSKLGQYAWYDNNSRDKTHPVAKKKPNRWGLYDMHGNVCEWVSSCYTKTYNSGCYENYKVLRGGGWINSANYTRSAVRNYYSPDDRYGDSGFRLARTK